MPVVVIAFTGPGVGASPVHGSKRWRVKSQNEFSMSFLGKAESTLNNQAKKGEALQDPRPGCEHMFWRSWNANAGNIPGEGERVS